VTSISLVTIKYLQCSLWVSVSSRSIFILYSGKPHRRTTTSEFAWPLSRPCYAGLGNLSQTAASLGSALTCKRHSLTMRKKSIIAYWWRARELLRRLALGIRWNTRQKHDNGLLHGDCCSQRTTVVLRRPASVASVKS
jgi:hypothetical protein